jgi:hypothetical protein
VCARACVCGVCLVYVCVSVWYVVCVCARAFVLCMVCVWCVWCASECVVCVCSVCVCGVCVVCVWCVSVC